MPDIPTLYQVSIFFSGFVAALQYFMSRRQSGPTLRLWAGANVAFCIGYALFLIRPAISDVFSMHSLATVAGNAILLTGIALMAAGAERFAGRRMPAWQVLAGPVALVVAFLLIPFLGGGALARLFVTTIPIVLYLGLASRAILRLPSPQTFGVRLICAATATAFGLLYAGRAAASALGLFGAGDPVTDASGSLIRISALAVTVVWNLTTLYLVHDREASTDALTGLLGRGAFLDSGRRVLGENAAARRPVALLMLDLDRFKTINDRFGHAGGDAVLQTFATTLTHVLRRRDIAGRIGGEEFCVLLADCPGECVHAITRRLHDRIRQALREVDGLPVNGTVSIGVATRAPASGTLTALMKEADDALYLAKTSGRDRICLAPEPVALSVRLAVPSARQLHNDPPPA